MATFNKFDHYVQDKVSGVHQNFFLADSDTLKIILTNDAPDVTWETLSGVTGELSTGNGYTNGGEDASNAYSVSGGTITVTGTDVVWTASGGSFGPFQYAILYNDTPTSPADPLIGWWDYGSAQTVNSGQTFTVDFPTTIMNET